MKTQISHVHPTPSSVLGNHSVPSASQDSQYVLVSPRSHLTPSPSHIPLALTVMLTEQVIHSPILLMREERLVTLRVHPGCLGWHDPNSLNLLNLQILQVGHTHSAQGIRWR